MKLGFEESQSAYESPSQSARAWTERWVSEWMFCPNCGAPNIRQYPANRPVADFFCTSCGEDYELKSQKGRFGAKVLDGAFGTMCARLEASNNPNLLLMKYDRQKLGVTDLFIVPKHFFVREIIEERKPLAATAHRAGWVGCNILLNQIPASGKIFIVRDSQILPKDTVLAEWRKTLFLRTQDSDARGWFVEVMKCVESLGKREFGIEEVYAFEGALARLYPNNQNVRPKIRQKLQELRDQGYLDFTSRGRYRLR